MSRTRLCHLQCINQTGKQILAVINDVLDHSKVEPNLSSLDFQKIWTTLYGLLREPLNVLLFHGENPDRKWPERWRGKASSTICR